MNEKKLRERVNVQRVQHGQYKVTITYHGKEYTCLSNNSLAWDDLDEEWVQNRSYYKTDKQCLMACYNECKRANNLGEYNLIGNVISWGNMT